MHLHILDNFYTLIGFYSTVADYRHCGSFRHAYIVIVVVCEKLMSP